MTCSRSQDLDLAAYLVNPTDSEWDDFRGHFPTCVDCSAAVESWTKLERALRARAPETGEGPHPDPLSWRRSTRFRARCPPNAGRRSTVT